MLFYGFIQRNPELLIGLVTEDDVKEIAEKINATSDEYVCSRIAFELSLSGNSGESPHSSPSNMPLLAICYDVLSERFFLEKKNSSLVNNLKKLPHYLNELNLLINKKEITDILLYTETYTEIEIEALKNFSSCLESRFSCLLFDYSKYKFQKNKPDPDRKSSRMPWGKLGFYTLYLEKAVDLYVELTGKKFTSDFVKNCEGIWEPATEGTRFIFEFHKIINKMAKKCNITPYSDKNFKSVSNDIRKQLHSL